MQGIAQVHLCLCHINLKVYFFRCHGCCTGICCDWSVHKFILALDSPLWGRLPELLLNHNSNNSVISYWKVSTLMKVFMQIWKMLLHFEILEEWWTIFTWKFCWLLITSSSVRCNIIHQTCQRSAYSDNSLYMHKLWNTGRN